MPNPGSRSRRSAAPKPIAPVVRPWPAVHRERGIIRLKGRLRQIQTLRQRATEQAGKAEETMHSLEQAYFHGIGGPEKHPGLVPRLKDAMAEWMRLRTNAFANDVAYRLLEHGIARAQRGERWELSTAQKAAFVKEAKRLYRPVLETKYIFRGTSPAENEVRTRRLQEALNPLLAWLNHFGLGIQGHELANW